MAFLDILKQKVYRPVVLLILDGWGIAPSWGGNAISIASTKNFDYLWRTFPHTTLCASGECVGLPGHEAGNSEVGHLNIGAGRDLDLDISRINKAIENGSFFQNESFLKAIHHIEKTNGSIHLIGLLSDGGVHSHINHLFALLEMLQKFKVKKVFIHPILDGRDTPQSQALIYIEKLKDKIKKLQIGQIATLAGRFYAMDRDRRWERTKTYYETLTLGKAKTFPSPEKAISFFYRHGYNDELMPPAVINKQGTIKDGDAVILFNFRADRARQITQAFLQKPFKGFRRKKLEDLFFVTFVPYFEYDIKLPAIFAFKPQPIHKPLGEVLAQHNFKQFHLAETEKYAHVTYFFNGTREKPFKGEDREIVPSPKVKTYDLKPEMSVYKVTNVFLEKIKMQKYHFFVVNFANLDMVGHTGQIQAVVQAAKHVDNCLKNVFLAVQKTRGILLITADHGNAEEMINPQTGEINPEHTNNPVPFIYINLGEQKNIYLKTGQALKNIAPFILQLFNLNPPQEMTAEPLASFTPVQKPKNDTPDNYWSI
ncbi:2,3-bisphosphoglycerate-independent phosphoglycerate mutase [bacterium]|nr:2,3-bisphosphoglycerate-independent phosphoglycerate mutase [bacterium]